MACGGCGSGRQYSHISVRRAKSGATRRRSAQSNMVVFSERDHGGYKLQVNPEGDESFSQGNSDSDTEHVE